MKGNYSWLVPPDPSYFDNLWGNAVFIFDTNVLLNLYRYSDDTVAQLMRAFKRIQNRTHVPDQVATEYFRNRLLVITEQREAFAKLATTLVEAEKKQRDSISLEPAKKVVSERKAYFDSLVTQDSILAQLDQFFPDSAVGSPYDKKRFEELCSEGKARLEANIPPGTGDKKKPEPERYGDFMLWSQILDHAADGNKSVIFITEDSEKDDWFHVVNGHRAGPLPSLRREFAVKGGSGRFYIYRMNSFLDYCRKYLRIDTSKSAVEEVARTTEEDEEANAIEKYVEENTISMSPSPAVPGHIGLFRDMLETARISSEMSKRLQDKWNEFGYLGFDTSLAGQSKLHDLISPPSATDYLSRFLSQQPGFIRRTNGYLGDLHSKAQLNDAEFAARTRPANSCVDSETSDRNRSGEGTQIDENAE